MWNLSKQQVIGFEEEKNIKTFQFHFVVNVIRTQLQAKQDKNDFLETQLENRSERCLTNLKILITSSSWYIIFRMKNFLKNIYLFL